MTGGDPFERLAAQALRLPSAREGRRAGSDVLRRGYLGKCERAGVRLCKGAG